MYIKQLIKNEDQYWNFVWPFVEWSIDSNRSLWRAEDYPKLKPFFDIQNHRSGDWTPEVRASFDFYEKCRKEYGDKNKEMRDAVRQFSPDDVLDGFGYHPPLDEEEELSKDKRLSLNEDFGAKFPFVIIGEISCGFDRLGDIKIFAVHVVNLEDFND